MITIQSDRLKVEIAEPGSIYQGTRFDWTGFITQVTLDGKHTYCVPESYQPGHGTGGVGLCNEFGIEKPIGYDDAQPGEVFPKLGIGLLKRKDTTNYRFIIPYEIVQRFPVEVEKSDDRVCFKAGPLDCRGYAARLTKTVHVQANELHIAYLLENTGSRLIDTHEYCHNFMGIDGHPIGPAYRLRFPYPVQLEDLSGAFRHVAPPLLRKLLPGFLLDKLIARIALQGMKAVQVEGDKITFQDTPQASFYCRPLGFSRSPAPQWELLYGPDGVGLSESDDFTPARVAVWGEGHVISAEVFVDIRVQPGETQRWMRKYHFFAEKE